MSHATRVQHGNDHQWEGNNEALLSMPLNQNHDFVEKEGKDIDNASKQNSSVKNPDQYAQVLRIPSDDPEQDRTLRSYQDVRLEIDELEKTIRRCSGRLRTFAANFPPSFPTIHKYGVESFITWCSLTSSSMLSLHEYFEERHIDRPVAATFESTLGKHPIDLGEKPVSHSKQQIDVHTSNARTFPGSWAASCSPGGAAMLSMMDDVVQRMSKERADSSEQHKIPVHHEADLSRQQHLPPISSLLSDDHTLTGADTLSESASLVQLRYDSTARSTNITRRGRISKAKKGLKIHNCECGRSYTRLEHLKRHQKNHANDDALVCDYPSCGKIFYRPDLLLRHRERHHEPHEAQPSEDAAQFGSATPAHRSSSSQWLDLGSPTDVFDFFSEPFLDPPGLPELRAESGL